MSDNADHQSKPLKILADKNGRTQIQSQPLLVIFNPVAATSVGCRNDFWTKSPNSLIGGRRSRNNFWR
jgi:hypothetical protein